LAISPFLISDLIGPRPKSRRRNTFQTALKIRWL
jgi:hypothetical protein